jgi:hypothetical protein
MKFLSRNAYEAMNGSSVRRDVSASWASTVRDAAGQLKTPEQLLNATLRTPWCACPTARKRLRWPWRSWAAPAPG